MLSPSLYLDDGDCQLWHGDALQVLQTLPGESVDCALTSPPFYALRDYGVEGQIGLESSPEEWAARLVEVFREVRRVLREGAPFVVTYSNRFFPTKAVRIWTALDDRERAGLIGAYFRNSGGWDELTAEDRSIDSGAYNDPLYAVWARKAAGDGGATT